MLPLISDETLKLLEANEAEQQRKTKENVEAQYVRFDNIMDDNGWTGIDR